MAEPNIIAFRIDERLIHGQGQLWIKALGVNTVIVANDSASEDSMQQTLMKAVVPKTIAMRFFSCLLYTSDHCLRSLYQPRYQEGHGQGSDRREAGC